MGTNRAERKRVVITAGDLVGAHASGRGLRAVGLAGALAPHFDVCLLFRAPAGVTVPTGVTVAAGPAQRGEALARADVVITANELSGRELASLRAALIVDLYDPHIFQLAWLVVDATKRAVLAGHERLEQRFAFEHADLVLCATQRQRDLYIGARIAAGRRDLDKLESTEPLGVVVVPNGIDDEGPDEDRSLRSKLGLCTEDLLFVWGGGIWSFLDPELAVAAVVRARDRDPRVRLLFLGISRHTPPTAREISLLEACRATHGAVLVNEQWVASSSRGAYLAASDGGILAQHASLEADFSFRTRLVDCMWARLPVVATSGDPLTEEAMRQGWAITSPPGQVDELAASILAFASPGRREEMRAALELVRPAWTWKSTTKALVEAVNNACPPSGARRAKRSVAALRLAAHRRRALRKVSTSARETASREHDRHTPAATESLVTLATSGELPDGGS
jgi:glycosyltransferase involved in cell wall biosynthesis